MKRILLVTLICCYAIVSKAQQDPQWTHFMYDKLSFNPASAGFGDGWCLTGIGRSQWTGLNAGEPKTTLLNFTTPNISLIKGGLGVNYYNDQLGYEVNNMFRLSYSLHLDQVGVPSIGGGSFAVGFAAGYYSKRISAVWIPPSGGLPTSDPVIPNSTDPEGTITFNGGLYYAQPHGLYAGLSVTNVSGSELSTLKADGVRHYFFMAGHELSLNNLIPGLPFDLDLKPNVLMKSDLSKTQYDLNLHVLAFKTFWVGVTYRLNDAIAPMAGIQKEIPGIGDFRLGYSYGIGTSFIGSNFSNGSHELMLSYCFKIKPPRPKEERQSHPLDLKFM